MKFKLINTDAFVSFLKVVCNEVDEIVFHPTESYLNISTVTRETHKGFFCKVAVDELVDERDFAVFSKDLTNLIKCFGTGATLEVEEGIVKVKQGNKTVRIPELDIEKPYNDRFSQGIEQKGGFVFEHKLVMKELLSLTAMYPKESIVIEKKDGSYKFDVGHSREGANLELESQSEVPEFKTRMACEYINMLKPLVSKIDMKGVLLAVNEPFVIGFEDNKDTYGVLIAPRLEVEDE